MKFQHIAAAAAIALAPAAASAVTVISDGGSYTFNLSSDQFIGEVTAAGGAGSWQVQFSSLLDPLTSTASATIGNIVAGTFTDLTMKWISVATATELASVSIVPLEVELATTFASPDNLSQYLEITWSDSLAGAGFDVEVSAVPLPAAGWLFLSALAGMGLLSRQRKAA